MEKWKLIPVGEEPIKSQRNLTIIESSEIMSNVITTFFKEEWLEKITIIGMEDQDEIFEERIPVVDNYLNQAISLSLITPHTFLVIRVTNYERFKESANQEILQRIACFINNKGEFTHYLERLSS